MGNFYWLLFVSFGRLVRMVCSNLTVGFIYWPFWLVLVDHLYSLPLEIWFALLADPYRMMVGLYWSFVGMW